MVTQFWDMHSGGGTSTAYELVFIEAEEKVATQVFMNRFDQSPYSVNCSCCGPNFAIGEYESIAEATEYHRKDKTVEEFFANTDYLFISKEDITTADLQENEIEAYVSYEEDYEDET